VSSVFTFPCLVNNLVAVSRGSRGGLLQHWLIYIRDKLSQIPEDQEELSFGNDCYRVTFEERKHKGLYGHAYHFFLQDAVEDVPEYVVNWDNFVKCVTCSLAAVVAAVLCRQLTAPQSCSGVRHATDVQGAVP
jgi:hypothetical protein